MEDDGWPRGLSSADLEGSLTTLHAMAQEVHASDQVPAVRRSSNIYCMPTPSPPLQRRLHQQGAAQQQPICWLLACMQSAWPEPRLHFVAHAQRMHHLAQMPHPQALAAAEVCIDSVLEPLPYASL